MFSWHVGDRRDESYETSPVACHCTSINVDILILLYLLANKQLTYLLTTHTACAVIQTHQYVAKKLPSCYHRSLHGSSLSSQFALLTLVPLLLVYHPFPIVNFQLGHHSTHPLHCHVCCRRLRTVGLVPSRCL